MKLLLSLLFRGFCITASLILSLLTCRLAGAQERVLVAYAGINETAAPMWVGIEKGLFRKNGLDVSMLQLRSGPLMMATLASGSVQLVWPSPSSVLSAVSGGLKIGCVASPVNRIGRHLMVRKEIKSLEEIRGKIFGVQSIGGGFWLQTMLVLDHLALDPDRYQLKFRVIGDTATVTQALITGQIDAAVLPYSFSEMARRTGFHALADAADLKGVFQLTGLCANRDLILRSPDLVTRLIRGIIEAVVFVHDSSNKQDVMQVLRKNLRFEKVEDTETSYRVLRQIVSLDVAPNSEAWGRIQRIVSRVNPKVGQVDLNQILEGSFTRKLEEEGYLPEARRRLRP